MHIPSPVPVASRFLLTIATLLALAGCAGNRPVIDFATDTDFSQYTLYRWQASSQPQAIDNDFLLLRVQRAVAAQLPQRGLQPGSEQTANLLVDISQTGSGKAPASETRGGIGLGGGSGGIGLGIGLSIPLGKGKETLEYRIVVDFKDAQSGELKWRGTQSFTSSDTGAALEQKVTEAVGAILAEYPPG